MCGIAGVVARPGSRFTSSWLEDAAAALGQRGPDDVGFLQWTPGEKPRVGRAMDPAPAALGFVHRRLSILDLTDAAWQPMSSPDGVYHLVYNGEIYNYVELRHELEGIGYRFHSTGDTEVLLAALRQWGTAALPRLVGMFAFALLDTQRSRLLLARDPFGIKPLFYAAGDFGLGFSSEIPVLLDLPGVSRRADAMAAYDYLRHGLTDHDERSLFADVRRLPGGHLLDVDLTASTEPSPSPYSQLDPVPRPGLSRADAAGRLRELFLESIRLHLRSDVVVGTALSGGIDSSAIVMAMRAVGGPDLDIRTFSWVADEPEINEERWVDLVASAAGAQVHKVRAGADDLVADLGRLIEAQGEPFRSTSIYAQYRVFELAAASGVKVMLDGQGADELLGGYRAHLSARAAGLARDRHLVAAGRLVRKGGRLPGGLGVRDLAARAGGRLLPASLQKGARRLAREELMPRWMDADWFASNGVAGHSVRRDSVDGGGLRETLVEDVTRTSLPALLRYEDRNSMAWSVESRVPFLTPALAEFVLSLPEALLVDDEATSKAVFRDAMRGIVPDQVLDRRDKIGFATPERSWMGALSGWVETVLSSEGARAVPALRPAALDRSSSRVMEGPTWRAVNLIRWSEEFEVEWA
jgi:asparagine synthase (glutamine-hydrolysing)